ncbi:MAG: prolipoprotein diacylglyceryl transferase [Alphaproteobacteria bacterium]|nr:prolipoprotein diacylglyceryl transferase [Alphaproteobacteria bacterium]MBF0250005.1 prolipoprotein diacylglyceryl transferase [Alphaproteobacteria bacterium]
MFAIAFPMIDPVLVEIGPVAIRWYALAYIAGLVLGWRYMIWLARQTGSLVREKDADDFLTWATFAVIIGGRLGYVLFYKPGHYLSHPAEILQTWQGGMSFHGGFLGVLIATVMFTRLRGIRFWAFIDMAAVVTPIGLFFGRIANFINAELWGRVSDAPWAMVFPGAGPLPRHPSQLYEAALEGLVLLVILHLVWRRDALRLHPGVISGAFLMGYGASRTVVEFFREPDAHLGLLAGGATMGQYLSVPMVLAGAALAWYARTRPRAKPE